MFDKKLFRLPSNTQNSILYQETFFEKLQFQTMHRNSDYPYNEGSY